MVSLEQYMGQNWSNNFKEHPGGIEATWNLNIPQFCDGSAYLSHMKRIRAARGDTLPESAYEIPLIYQAVSDKFLSWCEDIPAYPYEYRVDFEAEVGVIVDKVPMGISVEDAGEHIKWITIINDISLRQLCAIEIKTGFGFLQGKPHSALGQGSIPVLTLDEKYWHNNKFHGTMVIELNDKQIGRLDTASGMHFDFAQLIAHTAKTRELGKGTLIGSGTVSSHELKDGFGCLLERNVCSGDDTYMKSGDKIKMYIEEFKDSLIINQKVL
jgi:fumarylacetoacetate (FAA) hydrolase